MSSHVNSRNGSPEMRNRQIREDDGAEGDHRHNWHHHHVSRTSRREGDDYADLIDEEGDYSTPSGKLIT